MDPTYPHDVIGNTEALLAGVARSDGETLTEYQWQFGDGTKSQRRPVSGPLALEAKHIYLGQEGRVYRATLTVWDDSGASGTDDYYLRIRPDNLRTRAFIAADLALWNIHKRMIRYEEDEVPLGFWESPAQSHRIGITAACLQAFQNLGNFPFDDPQESPYVDDVRRGLNDLLVNMKPERISPQNAGVPDLNGNGIGLLCHHDPSFQHLFASQGLAMMALVMSRAPNEIASAGGPQVLGRKYIDLVQDMIDFIAFGQTDENLDDLVTRGGWRYHTPNSGEADLATTEWPVSGLMMAERNWGKFGIRVPAWVKTELRDNFLVADRDTEGGGWRYIASPTSHVNVGLTGIGLLCCAWSGVPFDDPIAQSGLSYISDNWFSTDSNGLFGHFTSMFSKYAIANAAKAYGSDTIGGHDWYEEYTEYLLTTQNPDGSWTSQGHEKSWPLTAAWAVLMLLEPQTPPSVIIHDLDSAQQDLVPLSYVLLDDNYDECSLAVEFSTDDGGNWSPATQADGDPLTYSQSSPDGVEYHFIWDTEADLGQVNLDNVLFRITPFDGERGTPGETILPGIYNDVVPFERVEVDAPIASGRGVSAADYDGDGDADVFVANFGQPDFLLRNDSGVLVENALLAGMDSASPSTCGVWGDFNNDGAVDLYLVIAGRPNRLYASDGQGAFVDVTSQYGGGNAGGGTCAAWADYDDDHWLDLSIGNHPAFGSPANGLYRNWGAGGFSNLAGPLQVDCPLATSAAAWGDFDCDGNIDLYVANASFSSGDTSNRLFRNPPASLETPFLDVSLPAGVADPRGASAVIWADLNDDGLLDLFLVNSGSDGNALFLNNGDGTFRDETAIARLQGPPDARGAAAADCDNDGDLDIFVSADGKDCLYLNRGDGTFVEVAALAGIQDSEDSRGTAWTDLNEDGYLDLYIAHNDAKDVLYLNRGAGRNWLRVRCLTDADGDATDDSREDDRDAIGATVALDLDGNMDFSAEPPDRLLTQVVDGGSGYMSQGQLWPHFGLQGYPSADLRVTFPDGSVVYRCGVAANQTITIRDIAPTGAFYVQVFTPQTPRSGDVIIGYLIFNSTETECDVRVEYSSDGGTSWQLATRGRGGEGTSDLLSSPLGAFHTFHWNSIQDLGFTNRDEIRIRITPLRPEPGQPGETSDFSVYNNTSPQARVDTPAGVFQGNIPIHYVLTDLQSDTCSISIQYSTDSGQSWRLTAAAPGGDGTSGLESSPQGTPHIYIWNSVANLGNGVFQKIKVRITPSDTYNDGDAVETDFFSVNNNSPPSAIVETPDSVQRGDVPLQFHVLDPESDFCSVEVFYSLDGGRTWLPATMAPGGDGTSDLASAPSGHPHTYVWGSLTDFGNDYSAAARILVAPRDAKPGTPAQTADFAVDNLRPAELAFAPTSFSFSGQEGGDPPPPQVLRVWNNGSHSLEWSAVSDVGWLVLYPPAGVTSEEEDAIEVSADTTGLSAGTYSATITLAAPGATGSPATVPVTLDLSPPPPSLSVSQSLLSFVAEEDGTNPAPQFVEVRNAGGGDMSWQAEPSQQWITLSPDSGSSAGETDAIEVQIDIGQLSPGSHFATLTISAAAANSPQVVAISLDIRAATRVLEVSPGELDFVTRRGGPDPPSQELRLTISGNSTVEWEAHKQAEWLSLSPSSGTNAGEETTITVSIAKTGLDLGTYSEEVTFETVGLPATPQTVLITLHIVPIVVPDDFPSIQEAVNEAESLDVVLVKPGLYYENVVMKDGVEVIGSGVDQTRIINGNSSSVIVFDNVRSGLLEGFTITGGTGDYFGRQSRVGGGMYCVNTRATVRSCIISANSAAWGGGVCVDHDSTLTLEDCSIAENTAASGGGIFCYENCEAILLRSRLLHNSANQYGAGTCVIADSALTLKSCEVAANVADLGGGGLFAEQDASLEIQSSTITDNLGEGILANPGASVTVANSILWSNSVDLVIPGGQSVRYCDIGSGDWAGDDGNVSEDPCFVAPEKGCYDLLPNSPCIDAGSNAVAGLPATDIHGGPRIVAVSEELRTDIGADEHDPDTIFILVQLDPQPGVAGDVTIPFSLWSAKSLAADIVVEFSIGGGAWQAASRANGEGTTALSSSPGGSAHAFVWDSVPDLKGTTAKSLRIRIHLLGEDVRPGATTNPFSLENALFDADDDGLPDVWEQDLVDRDPHDDLTSIADVTPASDSDGDGSNNLTEYLARTDPLNPRSVFKASCTPGQDFPMLVRWESVAGRFYQVYGCQEMGGQWTPIGPRHAGTGGTLSFADDGPAEAVRQRYYRVSVE